MGLTRGVEVYVRKVAPLGDPVEINVRGYELSLRKADAEMVEIDGEEEGTPATGTDRKELLYRGAVPRLFRPKS